jgi:hypothetical protein
VGEPFHGVRGAEISDQDALASAGRLQAGSLAQFDVQGGELASDGVAGGDKA